MRFFLWFLPIFSVAFGFLMDFFTAFSVAFAGFFRFFVCFFRVSTRVFSSLLRGLWDWVLSVFVALGDGLFAGDIRFFQAFCEDFTGLPVPARGPVFCSFPGAFTGFSKDKNSRRRQAPF